MNLGLSYSCQPKLTAAAFLGLCGDIGVMLTDLRPDNGQGWEQSAGDPFAGRGLDVVSLNSRVILGQGQAAAQIAHLLPARRIGHDILRIFLAEGADSAVVAHDLTALAEAGYPPARLAIETHDGFADAKLIADITAAHGTRVIFDTLGLWKIAGPGQMADIHALAPDVVATHVKGFETAPDGTTPHAPVATGNWPWTAEILRMLPADCPVILETRHPGFREDLSFFKQKFKAT
jgi:hypothetical protein